MTIFYYLYGYLPYRYFYFKKSLRTSAAATALRIMWALMVLSTTTFGMSRIPTGSSPNIISIGEGACHVKSGGDVGEEYSGHVYWGSCGIAFTPRKINFRSPCLNDDVSDACYVGPNGNVVISGYVYWDSCGKLSGLR